MLEKEILEKMVELMPVGDNDAARKMLDRSGVRFIFGDGKSGVYHDGMLFGILPKDAGPSRNQFVCVDPRDCRTFTWASGKENRFGLGPYMIADGKFQ